MLPDISLTFCENTDTRFLHNIANKHGPLKSKNQYWIQRGNRNIPKMLPIVPFHMYDLSCKFHETSFICFPAISLIKKKNPCIKGVKGNTPEIFHVVPHIMADLS